MNDWNVFTVRHPWVVLDPDGEHYTRFTNEAAAVEHARVEGGTVVVPEEWERHRAVLPWSGAMTCNCAQMRS